MVVFRAICVWVCVCVWHVEKRWCFIEREWASKGGGGELHVSSRVNINERWNGGEREERGGMSRGCVDCWPGWVNNVFNGCFYVYVCVYEWVGVTTGALGGKLFAPFNVIKQSWMVLFWFWLKVTNRIMYINGGCLWLLGAYGMRHRVYDNKQQYYVTSKC